MTVNEAIAQCDALKPNQYTVQEKIRWLSRLDKRIKEEILDAHEGGSAEPFREYTEGDLGRELLAASPYDEMYPLHLQSQVEFYQAEYNRYNNTLATFNGVWDEFANYINRTRMPKGQTEFRV